MEEYEDAASSEVRGMDSRFSELVVVKHTISQPKFKEGVM